jgi:hypothetical protein
MLRVKFSAFSIPDWARGLRRPLQLGLAAGILAAIGSLFMPNYYRSEARILPVEGKSALGSLGNLTTAAAALGLSMPGGGEDTNYVDILASRWMREQLLNTRFTFTTRFGRFGRPRPRVATLYEYLRQPNMDRAVREMGGVLMASRDPKTKLLSISVETRSPELSRDVARKACTLLESFVKTKGQTRGGYKALFAEARLKDARDEMGTAEDAFRNFTTGNRNYQTSMDPSIRLKGLRLESELKLRQQLVVTLAINREQALMEEKNDVPILNILDAGNLPVDKSKPPRGLLAMLTTFLVALGTWTYQNRERFIHRA